MKSKRRVFSLHKRDLVQYENSIKYSLNWKSKDSRIAWPFNSIYAFQIYFICRWRNLLHKTERHIGAPKIDKRMPPNEKCMKVWINERQKCGMWSVHEYAMHIYSYQYLKCIQHLAYMVHLDTHSSEIVCHQYYRVSLLPPFRGIVNYLNSKESGRIRRRFGRNVGM